MSIRHRSRSSSLARLTVLAAALFAIAGCTASGGLPVLAPVQAPNEEVALDAYVAPDATLVVRLDAARLRDLPLFQAILDQADAHSVVAGSPLGPLFERCGTAWWRGIDELVLSGTDEEHLLVVVSTREPEAALACASRLGGRAVAARFRELEGVELGGDVIAVLRGGRLFAGRRELVLAALEQAPAPLGPTHVLHRMAGTKASAVRVHMTAPPALPLAAVGVALEGDEQHFRLLVSLQGRSPAEADQLVDDLAAAVRVGKSVAPSHVAGDELRAVMRALSNTVVQRHVECTVGVELAIEDVGERQAAAFSAFTGFSMGIVNGFRKSALAADAQARLTDIAQRVAAYAEAHRSGPRGLPQLPGSAPATPEQMPEGAPARMTAASWSHPTWRELEFAPEEQSFFSYEIVTSRDRRSARIRARGDVDGDGELDELEIQVRVRLDGQVVIEPKTG